MKNKKIIQDLFACVALENITSEAQAELLVPPLFVATRRKRRRTLQHNDKQNVVWYVLFHTFKYCINSVPYKRSWR